jgi:hypothetical protein
MTNEDRDRPGGMGLTQNIASQIIQRTWGRVYGLEVELAGGRLVIHGRTSSYYVKQLALLAALESLGSAETTAVELDIRVGAGKSGTARRGYQVGASV